MTSDPHQNSPVLRAGARLSEAGGAVILLHGRGGSAEDILTLAKEFDVPQLTYLAPEAAGNSWYPNSFLAPIEKNEPWLSSALQKIQWTIESVEEAGIPTERVALCGFSQGACLATEYIARHAARYAGLIAFTGGLIGPPESDLSHVGDLAGTPAFFGSGDPDPHVPWKRVQHSAEILRGMGASVLLERYPGRPHTITLEEIEIARNLIRGAFGNKAVA